MAYAVIPLYDTLATQIAYEKNEHKDCQGIVALQFDHDKFPRSITGLRCLKGCKYHDFPLTLKEMSTKMSAIREEILKKMPPPAGALNKAHIVYR